MIVLNNKDIELLESKNQYFIIYDEKNCNKKYYKIIYGRS